MDAATVTSWTWDAELSGQNRSTVADLAYFRVETRLHDPVTAPVRLRLTADSRYRLIVNGELVAAGPAKPSGGVWFVDTVDISGQSAGRDQRHRYRGAVLLRGPDRQRVGTREPDHPG